MMKGSVTIMSKSKARFFILIIILATTLNVGLTILLSSVTSNNNYIYIIGTDERRNAIANEEAAIAFTRLLFVEHREILGEFFTTNPIDMAYMHYIPFDAVLNNGVWRVRSVPVLNIIDESVINLYAEFYQGNGRVVRIGID